MKTVLTGLALIAALTGCAAQQPHPATAEMQRLSNRTVTAWAITPGDKMHRLDIYVDGENAPAATLYLAP